MSQEGVVMLEDLEFTTVEGEEGMKEIVLLGSTTCQHFRQSLELLNEREIAYKYTFLDQAPAPIRKKTQRFLKENFTKAILCPFAIFGGDDFLTGYQRDIWEEKLNSIFPN